MKCSNCRILINIDGFGGYEHYISSKKSMDNNVNNGFFKIIIQNSYETIYECNECKTKWALSEPDFPYKGYFEQR